MTVRMCVSESSGFQSRLRVLTHISPVLEMLGWKILVRKNPAPVHVCAHLIDRLISAHKLSLFSSLPRRAYLSGESTESQRALRA